MPKYLDAASALVSPRSSGTNTPLKIYQYLRSGRPIVATRLRTHTQVLDDDSAVLVDPTADAFADGILRALNDPALAARVGARAIEVAAEKYSDEAFIEKTRRAFRLLADDGPAATVGDAA